MSTKNKTLGEADIQTDRRVGRRAAVALVGASVGAVGLMLGTTTTAHAIPGCTDSDPGDPAGNGRGRGISDSDPRDPGGCGRRSCSDSNPSDPAGRGRHC